MKTTRIQSHAALKIVAGTFLVLALGGCEAKLAEFFGPATTVGGGNSFPSLSLLNGGPVTINYNWISSTCDSPPLTDFTADADLDTSGTTLNIRFGDAPVPITGVYFEDTGAYSGDTGAVDIGSGLFANEMWTTNFTASGNTVSMTGTSHVDVTGATTCTRDFNVSFSFTF
jgi:hypothetical protein